MWKQFGKEVRVLLLLTVALHLASGATTRNAKSDETTLERDELMANVYADMGAIMKCLFALDSPEINQKITDAWTDHLERIQTHPTKPDNPNLAMEVLYEKAKTTLTQLQSIDNKCSGTLLPCNNKDATKAGNEIHKDLKDMENTLAVLAGTMECVLQRLSLQDELHRIFDDSLERMHSNYDNETSLEKVHQEFLQIIDEMKDIKKNCNQIKIKEYECIESETN